MAKQNRTFNEILLFIGFIAFSFVIYVVGVVVGFDFGRKNPNFIALTGAEVREGNYCQSLLPPEQDEIYSYSGIVKEVGDNSLIMESEIVRDYNLYKEELEVVLGPDTSYTMIDVTDPPPEQGDYPREEIGREEIGPGGFVSVTADENIKDKKEFAAENVELIINNN